MRTKHKHDMGCATTRPCVCGHDVRLHSVLMSRCFAEGCLTANEDAHYTPSLHCIVCQRAFSYVPGAMSSAECCRQALQALGCAYAFEWRRDGWVEPLEAPK